MGESSQTCISSHTTTGRSKNGTNISSEQRCHWLYVESACILGKYFDAASSTSVHIRLFQFCSMILVTGLAFTYTVHTTSHTSSRSTLMQFEQYFVLFVNIPSVHCLKRPPSATFYLFYAPTPPSPFMPYNTCAFAECYRASPHTMQLQQLKNFGILNEDSSPWDISPSSP